ncbi:tyrosine-type recombinase/integrase [Quadrisphaera granulorum]|uniref:tyrosine-type recombinase/integrase n=1 Tax=Quadrisphaera granulorum TaxID=317664 RepID=UPI001472A239|nr:hypothetical protein [Quadrisphaera granulorum]
MSVLGKGSQRRSVPLPRPLVVVLKRYLTDVRPLLPASGFLFPTLRRGGSRMGRDASVSTHLLRSGVDVVVVRDLMGDASVVTTSIYLQLLREDMRDGVDRAFG